jgi:hypothetical protein
MGIIDSLGKISALQTLAGPISISRAPCISYAFCPFIGTCPQHPAGQNLGKVRAMTMVAVYYLPKSMATCLELASYSDTHL